MATIDNLKIVRASQASAQGHTIDSNDMVLLEADTTVVNELLQKASIKTINGSTVLGSGNIAIDGLPSQSGQTGKFLTTNGTAASWAVPKTFNILDFKWSDHELNDQSWLKADTFSWQSGTVYSEAYNHLVADLADATASVETVGSYSITVYTATDGHKIVLDDMEQTAINIFNESGIAWYYIVDTTNTRFKLPRSTYNKYSKELPVKGNGITLGMTDGTEEAAFSFSTPGGGKGVLMKSAAFGQPVGTAAGNDISTRTAGLGVVSDPANSGLVASSVSDSNMKLYFYVGEFSQSATEQTAGLNAELFNGKVDVDSLTGCATLLSRTPNRHGGVTEIWSDGFCVQTGTVTRTATGTISITLDQAYRDTNYIVIPANRASNSYSSASTYYTPYVLSVVTNGFSLSSNAAIANIDRFSWRAEGYIS